MHNMELAHKKLRTVRNFLISCVLVVICVGILSAFALKIYLETPFASSLLSQKLTMYLHQPVRVTGLHTTGTVIYLTGVSLANPPNVQPGTIVEVDRIVIAPNWGALLTGKRSFRLIAFEGVKLTLLKDRAGIWNYSNLQQLFRSNKPSGTELIIEQLDVNNGAVQINGHVTSLISLHIFNITTNGSRKAQLELSFEDAARNTYKVSGTICPGLKPALDVTLEAPTLSLNKVTGLLKLKSNPLAAQSTGNLKLTATLHDGRLRSIGICNFSLLPVPFPKKLLPVTGSIEFAAIYNLNTDDLYLESLTVTTNNLVSAHASGTIAKLKSEHHFVADVSIDRLNLLTLTFLLPEKVRRTTIVGGSLERLLLHVSGSGNQGVTGAVGSFTLKDGSLEKDGQIYFTALTSKVSLSSAKSGFLVSGTLTQERTNSSALLETLQAPFEINLSHQLNLRTAGIPSLDANVRGVAVAGSVDARIIRSTGELEVTGNARLSGLSLVEKVAEARFTYRIADGTAYLDNVVLGFDGLSAKIASLVARLPVKEAAAGTTRYPLSVEVAGGEVRRGATEVHGFSGTMRGGYFSDSGGNWLEGTAAASSSQVVWNGETIAAPALLHATFFRTAVRGTISGTVLEGALNGTVSFDPRALPSGAEFQLGFRNVKLSTLGKLLPQSGTTVLSRGTLDSSLSGSYSRTAGLVGRFEASGSDISVADSGGKTLFGGGAVKLSGSLAGTRLVLGTSFFSVGAGVDLQVSGELDNPLTKQRSGSFVFSLPQVSLNSIIDRSVNILPRVIQEAIVDGTVASEGRVTLRDGRQLLDGSLTLKEALFEMPSQKFRAVGIHGRIPFSLDLSGNTQVNSSDTSSFTRGNYPVLLKKFQAGQHNGQSITISSVSFGPVSLGTVQLQLSAGNGVTKIESLRSSLYEGALLGTGFVAVENGISYRADLLIDGLSLKRFCSTVPTIKDYISGRLDGVISLAGKGKNVAGLTGFSDLWVREDSREKMLVSKDFLQKLSGKKLSGFFFSADRPFDQAEVAAVLEDGYLTFDRLDIVNTNLFGVRDLSVSIAPTQNRIAFDHLFTAIKQAAERGKSTGGASVPPPDEQEFTWQE
jgi:hypothetical protein